MSADGRYVAFAADADMLAPEANPDVAHMLRKDRATGEIVFVGRAGNGVVPQRLGRDPSISDDGGRVACLTRAAPDPADADDELDVYVRDVAAGTTILATPGTAGGVGDDDLSGNGAHVVFDTATPLGGASDGNSARDVYRRALDAGTYVLVSRKAGMAEAATHVIRSRDRR